ncbi:invasion associated locus B family protein [Defluviimonas sp. SAOS-178_SWC]|uniref:invasion associated locus B family protein n=1 Tax=Defluviimonas sp. SAOS-178_SWC TaxID=3121287 RepID=UPI003222005B
MPAPTRSLILILALAAATPALAQETTAPAAPDTAATAPADVTAATNGVGEPYVAETFDAWQLRCVRTEDGSDPCQLYQLLKDKETDKPISEISIVALPDGGEAVAGATVITPLETLLTQQLNITVDGGATKRYPFTFCADVGCVARVGFTTEDIDSFRKGKIARISVVPVADPTRTVDVDISLKGFTAGFEAVTKATAPKQ